ncbi:hypothetical protein HZ326_1531 [Fusarium oxysporum f. sp. albedinis]|nr:hypothetical protein HZ326_1531 [Fusarium oxysporum f. sp. albedinis]
MLMAYQRFSPEPPDRNDLDRAQTVLWTHGTSGSYPTTTPSTHRSLERSGMGPASSVTRWQGSCFCAIDIDLIVT